MAYICAFSRYLYLVGRMDLKKVEHDLAVAIVPAFFPGGSTHNEARLVVERLFERGVGAAPVHAAHAIGGLRERGVLTWVRGNVYRLERDDRWSWPANRHGQAVDEWEASTGAIVAWGPQVGLAYDLWKLLAALEVDVTFHPGDPVFAAWYDRVKQLAEMYGREVVSDALREGALDPEVVEPATPDGFGQELYALAQRRRRRRA